MFTFSKKTIIGRTEKVNIPQLGLFNIPAKIDTGAYRGSIHATDIKEVDESGVKILKFKLFDETHSEYKDKNYSFNNYKIHKFKAATVDSHNRFVIPVIMEIAGKKIDIELSLNDRKEMRNPILLGRRSLKKHFLIDVDLENI